MTISFTGLRHFKQPQIIALSGLFPGESVSLQTLSDAANRLAQYGVFQKVPYQYRTQSNQLDLTFNVVETDNLLSCLFDNFVWFTPDELNSALARDVPLYDGSVPQSGRMLQAIQNSLTTLLKQKGIPGDVQFTPFSVRQGASVSAILFSISAVALPIHDLHFPGASAIPEAELLKHARPLLGKDYSRVEIDVFVPATFLPLYGELGYLRARFDPPKTVLLGSDDRAPSQDVSITVQVHEGLSYDWKAAAWTGNRIFSDAALDKLLGMHAEAVANMQKFDAGVQAIRDAYLKQGYLQIDISPQQELDDSTRHVAYQFSIDEGPQFHMGAVTVVGLPEKASRRFLKAWKLRPGDVYDGTYLQEFMKQAIPDLYRSGMQFNNPKTSIHTDSNTNTVNVEIAFP